MKRQLILSAFCLIAAVLLLVWGFNQDGQTAPQVKESYALIIDDDTGSFLMQLRKGMQAAAEEFNAQFTVISNQSATSLDGYAAVMLYLQDPAAWITQNQALVSVPIIVIGKKLSGYSCVFTEDAATTFELLDKASESSPEGLMVVVADQGTERAIVRSEAAIRWANRREITTVPYASETVILPESCTIAVATSTQSTLALAAMKRSGDFKGQVYGVDTGNNRARDLEDEAISVMLIEKPYAMGYLSMKKACESNDENPTVESITVGVLLADQSNMYQAENVKQVFPLLQ